MKTQSRFGDLSTSAPRLWNALPHSEKMYVLSNLSKTPGNASVPSQVPTHPPQNCILILIISVAISLLLLRLSDNITAL